MAWVRLDRAAEEKVVMFEATAQQKIEMLRVMYLVRHFDARVVELFQEGLVRGATHVYLGEEAVAAAACAAIEGEDYITSTHRGHGHVIAKGADVNLMMAELLGKETGYCRGRGGSMHIADLGIGILGANGIVGGGIPQASGAGLSCRLLYPGRVCLCFFGDGACNQGSFHESANMAAAWKLPVVFICENNGFAVTTPMAKSTAVEDLALRAAGYGMPGETVDGNDALAVYDAVRRAVERARAAEGPTFVECKTYRWEGHYLGDPQVYRTKEEVALWKTREPIHRLVRHLVSEGLLSAEDAEAMDVSAKEAIDEAERFARESPSPDPAAVTEDVYYPAEVAEASPLIPPTDREITYAEALNEAMAEEMERDGSVVLMGEDIGFHGGAFQITKGLYFRFGEDRVRDTPLSEAAIAGAAVGACLTGLRPVAEIMYIDFSTIAMDQIINQAAKIRYMFGGKARLPVVFRTQCGGGLGGGPHHSQSLEAFYYHIPGLKVAIPSTPADAKGLLKTAIRDDNPVVFIEYKRLYHSSGPVPEGDYCIPFGVADVKREGTDVTVVATSAIVPEALAAAEELAADGVSVEVVDPRTLFPLDMDTIVESVVKTNRCVVAHEAIVRGGVGGEIAAGVAERAFDYLDAPIVRLGSVPVPMPYSVPLEAVVIPKAADIVRAVREVLA